MLYNVFESATGDELGTLDTSAETAVEDLLDAGWLDGEDDDYEVHEDHPMTQEGDLLILGPDFPELVLEPVDEYDDADEDGDEEADEDFYD